MRPSAGRSATLMGVGGIRLWEEEEEGRERGDLAADMGRALAGREAVGVETREERTFCSRDLTRHWRSSRLVRVVLINVSIMCIMWRCCWTNLLTCTVSAGREVASPPDTGGPLGDEVRGVESPLGVMGGRSMEVELEVDVASVRAMGRGRWVETGGAIGREEMTGTEDKATGAEGGGEGSGRRAQGGGLTCLTLELSALIKRAVPPLEVRTVISLLPYVKLWERSF
mmetsp:Transcript_12496/g.20375  ORF Transcript_12496/g.20375 Transcript_12496/m.20375 type:complete len:227 (-) Transcript_12496:1382-2062(-)